MKSTLIELQQILENFSIRLDELTDTEFEAKNFPGKWSKKEVLGHLIDSAQNNLRRFIVAQYESPAPKIVYDQNFWVSANGYQLMNKNNLISLWKLMNEGIVAVLRNMPEENYTKLCDTGKAAVQLRSIEWLAPDYIKHMKHHLNQIFPGSFDVIYP